MDRYRQEWDLIWKRRSWGASFIDFGRSVYNRFFRRVLQNYLRPDSTMLELGCGTSTLSLSFAPQIKELIGLDISDEALTRSRQEAASLRVGNARFITGDCRNLDLNREFDFVWSQGLVEHFDNPGDIIREHYKVLSPGGSVLISVPYRYSYHKVWYLVTRPRFLRRFWPWTDQHFFTKKELLSLGRAVTPTARVFLMSPSLLGIIMLELKK